MKKNMRFAAAVLTVCLALSLFPFAAYAGSSTTTIDGSSYAEKIDNTVWNNPNGDVAVRDGRLIFPAESTADTRLISKTAINKSELTENVLHASFALSVVDIPQGQTFAFAFGLRSIESFQGEKGNVEIAFTNDDGIQSAVCLYEEADVATVLAQPKAVNGNKITVEVLLKTNQQFVVTVNGKVIYDDLLNIASGGRVGFLQTGGCCVEVGDMSIKTYSYNSPENANVMESFDNGTMDTSLLTSSLIKDIGYFPYGISVEQYNGDYMMMFRNSGLGYIGTKYQYSNFEMTFDVPYMLRNDIYNKDFTINTPKNTWFGISFGDDYMNATWYDYDYKSPYMIYFAEWSAILDFKHNHKVLADLAQSGYAIFDENETRGYSIRFSVVDAKVEIGLKWLEETEFTTVCQFEIDNGHTPTGYIHIWGSEPGNFAIDNIKITNLDQNPQIIETQYKSGEVIVPDDFDFQREEMIFKESGETIDPENKGFNYYLLIPCSAAIAVAMVVCSAIFAYRRKRKAVA